MTFRSLVMLALLLVPLLAACGGAAPAAQSPLPTPTALPQAPEQQRPTYTVQRGSVERPLDVNGRITPVDLVRLGFHRAGRVASVSVAPGDIVKAGDVLAQLEQTDKLAALRQAEDTLTQAERDLAGARQQQADAVALAELDLREAQEDLARLQPGASADPARQAQRDLEQAQQAADTGSAAASEAKTVAEHDVLLKTEALQDAQRAYSTAWWDDDWVQRYGTHPTEMETDPRTGQQRHRLLTTREKEQFTATLTAAERALREAERNVALAQRTLEQKRADETIADRNLAQDVQDKQAALDLIEHGNADQITARRNVEHKQLALEQARQDTTNAALAAVENAQRALDAARQEVADGQIIAPQDGQVLSLAVGAGDTAEAYATVLEVADPSELEVAAELDTGQVLQIQPGQPVEIGLLSRPDIVMPAVVRLLQGGGGASGSTVQGQDHTTRFTITDTKGQQLTQGAVVKIHFVLERKENVLWLPPEAVRSFEGRRFVEVRDGDRTHRANVQVGIETPTQVEIISGVAAGDVVVGQ